jgi:hypothetical protein
MTKKPPTKKARDAMNGQYITMDKAKNNPDTTVIETEKPTPKKPTPKKPTPKKPTPKK